MSRIVLLDAGPLGLMCHLSAGAAIRTWGEQLRTSASIVGIPEVADYEVRRELIRLKKTSSITRLDHYKALFYYLPITLFVDAQPWHQITG
jgi:toxin FitB